MEAERAGELLERLRAGAAAYACGGRLAALDPLQRHEICTRLVFDRLERKMRLVESLHREAGENWNVTFYLLYFRTLGDRKNQRAYLELARRVPYKAVLRERLASHAVEAMLLGASGLLELYRHDDHTLDLRRAFEHLSAKYEIEPMRPDEWELSGIRPANHPVLRLAQAAAFFGQDEFVMARAMACRTEGDIRQLFCIEAPEYWRTHYVPGAAGDEQPKRLGAFKANIIGINLVAILQFAYGSYTDNESLRENALLLLEKLPAEENRYIFAWRDRGVQAANAFETQALLQLATEYCAPPAETAASAAENVAGQAETSAAGVLRSLWSGSRRGSRAVSASGASCTPRCEECPLGRRILHEARVQARPPKRRDL